MSRVFRLSRNSSLLFTLAFAAFFTTFSASAQEKCVPGVPWRAVDDLGRVVSAPKDVPAPRADRKVGLFYFLWLDGDIPRDRNLPEGENGPYDISKIEKVDPWPEQNDALVGSDAQMHYWGEPLFGYYASSDPYVLKRHVRLIADAGVDTLIFDTTNAVTYENAYLALCDVILEAFANGEPAPQVVFMTRTNATATIQKIWNEFYSHEKYRPVFFLWEDKPLILANPDEVPEELRDFFTIRDTYWPTDAVFRTHDAWRWVDGYPQTYSWHDAEDRPEQLNVSPAQNLARDDKQGPVWMGELIGRGRSFVYGAEKNRFAPLEGLNFAQQWTRAIEVDPQFLMITGWNEWIAGRWQIEWANRYAFVDQYDLEYSRDVEPVRGAALDAYYLQTVDGIRRFKGSPRPPQPAPRKSIDLTGLFEQWKDVEPTLKDYSGETEPRDFRGIAGLWYKKDKGRNDLSISKVARDDKNVYFYLETREALAPSRLDGLCLALDLDDALATGWRGAELVVGVKYDENGTVVAQYYDGSAAEEARKRLADVTKRDDLEEYPETQRLVDKQLHPYATVEQVAALKEWSERERRRFDARKEADELTERARTFRAGEEISDCRWRVEGNKLMIAVPTALFADGDNLTAVSFKWLDDVPLSSPANFYDCGDVAPESAFFYRVEFTPKE